MTHAFPTRRSSARAVEVAEALGGLAAPGERLEREGRGHHLEDLLLRHDLVGLPRVAAVERHELDEADDDAALAAVAGQVDDLVVVASPHHHDVHLHRAVELGRASSRDSVWTYELEPGGP